MTSVYLPQSLQLMAKELTMATILVVDDEKPIQDLLRTVLETKGYRVLVAENGSEGLLLHQTDTIDVTIIDMIMPDTDGIEMLSKLTEESPDVKIVAMTGASGDMNFLDVAKQCGVRHVFAKPFDMNELLKAIQEELVREPTVAPALASGSRKKAGSFFGLR
jgi:two-component system, response regulator, stage 0 sporulation protein F